MERDVDTGDAKLHIYERGSGGDVALLFLHFYGGSGDTWRLVVDQLHRRFRCISPDLRGFGDSQPSPDDDYSVDANADDIVDLIAELKLTRYVLVGHSMGGKFALAVAARLSGPNPVVPPPAALVLLAPSPPTPEPMSDADRESSREGQGSAVAAAKTLEKIRGRHFALPVALRAVDDMVRTAPGAWMAWLDEGSKEDISDRMAAITTPVFVLSGSRDPVIPTDVLQSELIARVAGSQLTVVPGAGHLLPLEVPDVVAGRVREVVRGLG